MLARCGQLEEEVIQFGSGKTQVQGVVISPSPFRAVRLRVYKTALRVPLCTYRCTKAAQQRWESPLAVAVSRGSRALAAGLARLVLSALRRG